MSVEETAQAHWIYSRGIIDRIVGEEASSDDVLSLCEYLYVQAFIHGYKHGKEES